MASGVSNNKAGESVLDDFVGALGGMATTAPAAAKVLGILGEQTGLSEDLKRVVRFDPVLTAVVLSAGGGHAVKPRTVAQYWEMLGESELISTLLTTAATSAGLGDDAAATGQQMELWRHSVAVAVICRAAAERLAGGEGEHIHLSGAGISSRGASEPELAYEAGLVHELGRVVLAVGMPKSLARAQRTAVGGGGDLLEAEGAVFGFGHTALGRRLAGKMGLAREVVECIWLHHHRVDVLPERMSRNRYLQLVLFAEAVARQLGLGEPGDGSTDRGALGLGEELGLGREFGKEVEEKVGEELDEATEVLGFDEPAGAEELAGHMAGLVRRVGELQGDLAEARKRLGRQEDDLKQAETLAEDFAETGRKAGGKDEGKRLNDLLAEVAAGAAHELNNPLAVIAGRSQMLAKAESDAEKKKALEAIDEQAREASEIVSELMEVAGPRRGKGKATDLVPIIRKLCAALAGKAQARGSVVNCELAEDLPEALVDAEMFEQSLLEILKNALESLGDEAGRIDVRCEGAEAQEKLLLEVADSGIGMDAELAEKAFVPFFSRRAAGRGRGLGLSRAKAFIEANGGRLWLRSQPGRGTTVYMLLPVAKEG